MLEFLHPDLGGRRASVYTAILCCHLWRVLPEAQAFKGHTEENPFTLCLLTVRWIPVRTNDQYSDLCPSRNNR